MQRCEKCGKRSIRAVVAAWFTKQPAIKFGVADNTPLYRSKLDVYRSDDPVTFLPPVTFKIGSGT